MARADVDTRIHESTLHLLRTRGPVAVSIESVAAASGVAKTTIYRRFDNREALLATVIAHTAVDIDYPTDLDARTTLIWVLSHTRATIEAVVGRGTVAAVLIDEDPEFTGPLRSLIRTTTTPLRDDLRARSARGELRNDLDVELTISILVGVVIAELIRGRTTDDAWARSAIDMLWPSLSPGAPAADPPQ